MVDEAIIKGPVTKEQVATYLTTIGLVAIPVIVAYQTQIIAMVPTQYAVAAAVVIGILAQAASGARVRAAKDRLFGVVDDGQEQLTQAQIKIAELQGQVDAAQAKIDEATQPIVANGAAEPVGEETPEPIPEMK